MQIEIISSQQLRETGRWDAAFNIAYKKHRSALKDLLTRVTKDDLVEMAKALPFNKNAARVKGGSAPPVRNFDKWQEEELGLYLLQIYEEGADVDALDAIRAEADQKCKAINSVRTLLGKAYEKGKAKDAK